STEYMRDYWKIAFMPIDIFSDAFQHFAGRTVPQVFSQLLPSVPGSYLYLITFGLFLTGLFAMFKEKKFLLLHLCVVPMIMHLALSAMHMYPFEQRMLLYHVPLYIVSITFGLFWIANRLIPDSTSRTIITSLSVVLISVKTFMTYPMKHDEIKDAIKYINETHKPGESIYIASGAVPGIKYYRQRDVAQFDDLSIEFGKQTVQDTSRFLQNIHKVHGRMWLVASDIFPFKNNDKDETAIASAIIQRGKLVAEKEFVGSTVYLYDIP
ncbi:MAG TPA: hypothetical protein VM187_05305, partial [Niastella sp.]|nr:hypothetical protein [Niastella sp.]